MEQNIGQNLDDLMSLDPRGYGVCRILYHAARAYTGDPFAMHADRSGVIDMFVWLFPAIDGISPA